MKPTLDVVRLPVFRVHADALNAFVEKRFGFEFDFCRATGVRLPETVEYKVNGQIPTEYEQRANDLRTGYRTRNVALILAVLAAAGDIAKGTYIVETREPLEPRVIYRRLLETTGSPESDECVAFRNKHRKDAELTRWFAALDLAILHQLRDQ